MNLVLAWLHALPHAVPATAKRKPKNGHTRKSMRVADFVIGCHPEALTAVQNVKTPISHTYVPGVDVTPCLSGVWKLYSARGDPLFEWSLEPT